MSANLMAADQLGKRIGERNVLDGVTGEVRPGDIVGLIGKNGAGKTTLLETLLGVSLRSAGTSSVLGEDSEHLSAAVKERVGFVPQQDELIPLLTGRRQLTLTAAFYQR